MADLFHSSPARSSPTRTSMVRSSPGPTTPRVTGVTSIRSPLAQHERTTNPPHSTPSTPTRSQPYRTDFMRKPITADEYSAKEPLRGDVLFEYFKSLLRDATTVVTFVWKPSMCRGKFKPIPYPVDPETGSLVDPQDLPKYLRTHEWTRPECLCILRGFKRTTTLLTPKRPESRAYGAICLVCPESECPYFVNLDELFRDHTDDILFANSCMSDSGDDASDIPPTASAKKRRLIKRVPVWKAVVSGLPPPQIPSSSPSMRSDASSTEVISIISEMLGPKGIPRTKFDSLFLLCDGCERVLPRLGQDDHKCVIETASDSGLDEDLYLVLGE